SQASSIKVKAPETLRLSLIAQLRQSLALNDEGY
ncbi:MAG: WYL domain-containing protein, partial [Pseudomonas sp.]